MKEALHVELLFVVHECCDTVNVSNCLLVRKKHILQTSVPVVYAVMVYSVISPLRKQ